MLESIGGIFLGLKLDEREVSANPNIGDFAVGLEMLFKIPDPCIYWIKVDDKQSLSGPHACCRPGSLTATRPTISLYLKQNTIISNVSENENKSYPP